MMMPRQSLSVLSPLLLVMALGGCVDDGEDGADGQDLGVERISLSQLGRYTSDDHGFDESAAEIVAYDAASARVFVVNAQAGNVDVLDLSDPTAPTSVDTLTAGDEWSGAAGVNSAAVANGLVAIAVENTDKTDAGRVQIYNASDLSFRGQVEVGALPDMVTFTPDGNRVLVANEGEPNADYSVDPKGSVSVVDVSAPDSISATTLDFTAFNAGGDRAGERPEGVRIFGNFGRTELTVDSINDADPAEITVGDAGGVSVGDWLTLASTEGDPVPYRVDAINGTTLTLNTDFDGDSDVNNPDTELTVYLHDGASSVAQDLEPEYISVAPDGTSAWATLQENNAVAEIDLEAGSIKAIRALGTKNHSLPGFELDPSNSDGGINIANHPVQGLYLPDAVTAFERNGETYYITANEGDAREYDAFVEEYGMADAPKNASAFGDLTPYNDGDNLGDIDTTLTADTDGDGKLDRPLVFGGRSVSIWNSMGRQVADTGSGFEVITARALGKDFNNDNDENTGDDRSDAKGPEPEAVTTAELNGRVYAFVGLERVGGVMVYDVSNPAAPEHVQYLNNRDFGYDIEGRIDEGSQPPYAAGDLGPESLIVIPAEQSPSEAPLLVVGNEVSATTTVYRIQ